MNIIKVVKKNKSLVGVGFTYLILFIMMPDRAVQSVKNSMYYIVEMVEILPVVFILTALIEAWVPKEIIMNSFGKKAGMKGSILSFLLGSFSAGPIYAAFPVCKMLLKKGATINNIVIILSAWAVVKVPMLANEAKFLGLEFMSIRWLLTTVSIFIMAYIVSLVVSKKDIPVEAKKNKDAKNRLEIMSQYCIGCGICEKTCPEIFRIVGGKAEIKTKTKEIEPYMECITKVIEKCPAKAIKFN